MNATLLTIAEPLGAAWLAGGLIGLERTLHGRAGFRTHSLVAVAAAAAVMVGLGDTAAASRLAQGVMTGIGFVGAGVIFKEGVSIQGLTTAASVWATAAIGLLFGVGEFTAGSLATAGVLVILIILRWVEEAIPTRVYAWARFSFDDAAAPDRAGFDRLIAGHGVTMREVSFRRAVGDRFEYRGVISAQTDRAFDDFTMALRATEGLAEFELSRISK